MGSGNSRERVGEEGGGEKPMAKAGGCSKGRATAG